MIYFPAIVFLAACALTQGKHLRISLESFTHFVECVKKQMIGGNEMARLPSFSPFQQKDEYLFPWNLGPNLHTKFNVLNVNWTGFPDFEYEFNEIPNDSHDTSIFEFKIFWKRLSSRGTWIRDRDFYGLTSHDSGLVTVDLYNRLCVGKVVLTKKKIVYLEVKSSLKNAKVHFSNVGKEQKILVPFTSQLWLYLMNDSKLYSQFIGKYYKDKFTRKWLQRPKRIDSILKECERY